MREEFEELHSIQEYEARVEALTITGKLFEEVVARAKVLAAEDIDEDIPEDDEDNVDLSDDLGVVFGDEAEVGSRVGGVETGVQDDMLTSEVQVDGKMGSNDVTDSLTYELYVSV